MSFCPPFGLSLSQPSLVKLPPSAACLRLSLWTDFGKLRADLVAQGCDVVIEKATGVGKVALKLVSSTDVGADEFRRTAAPASKNTAR